MADHTSPLFAAGVKEYRETYWRPGYEPADTDILAAFRVTPQEGVPRGGRRGGRGGVLDRHVDHGLDRPADDLERYQARVLPARAGARGATTSTSPTSPIRSTCSRRDRSSNMMASIVGQRVRVQGAPGAAAGGPADPGRVHEDVPGAAERDPGRARQAEQVRAPAARLHHQAEARPVRQELRPRRATSALRGGLDFTKDDENINSQPFMRWRDRYEFVMEAVRKAEDETGERKGHYLNVTAPDRRADVRARRVRQRARLADHHARLPRRRASRRTSRCRTGAGGNGMLLHVHRAMHAVIDRQKHHGIHFRVLAKWLRLAGGDHLHTGTVVGKLEGDRAATLGVVDLLREDFVSPPTAAAASTSTSSGRRCRASSRSRRAGSTSGTCPPWSRSSATTRCCSSVAARWAIRGEPRPARPPTASRSRHASRRATRAATSTAEGAGHPPRRGSAQPGAGAALETWREMRFDFDTVDTLDPAVTP